MNKKELLSYLKIYKVTYDKSHKEHPPISDYGRGLVDGGNNTYKSLTELIDTLWGKHD